MEGKLIRTMNFSKDTDLDKANIIIDELADLAAVSMSKNFQGLIEPVEMGAKEYKEKNAKVKEAILGFAADVAGLGSIPKNSTEMSYALDNTVFRDVINTINAKTLGTMMVRYSCPQIENLANIETVNAGDSKTYEIDTKSLPIAQKATYGSNVTMVPSYAKSSITVTPEPYSIGVSIDFIKLVSKEYDWAKAIARVYAGMLYAQYKVVVSQIFNSAILNGTPLYQENFVADKYAQLADDVGMLAGGNASNVLALGTRTAWVSIGALATQGGYSTKDEFIRNGFLQKIYGVDSAILDQFSNLSAPFTTANAPSLRAIPNNMVVVVPMTENKICQLVRENYIRVIETPSKDNSLNRQEYSYFQSFDAKLVAPSYFGLQGTNQA